MIGSARRARQRGAPDHVEEPEPEPDARKVWTGDRRCARDAARLPGAARQCQHDHGRHRCVLCAEPRQERDGHAAAIHSLFVTGLIAAAPPEGDQRAETRGRLWIDRKAVEHDGR